MTEIVEPGTREPRRPSVSTAVGTIVDGVEVLGALSPSRAADFKTCALKYRLRMIDRLPEPPDRKSVV